MQERGTDRTLAEPLVMSCREQYKNVHIVRLCALQHFREIHTFTIDLPLSLTTAFTLSHVVPTLTYQKKKKSKKKTHVTLSIHNGRYIYLFRLQCHKWRSLSYSRTVQHKLSPMELRDAIPPRWRKSSIRTLLPMNPKAHEPKLATELEHYHQLQTLPRLTKERPRKLRV